MKKLLPLVLCAALAALAASAAAETPVCHVAVPVSSPRWATRITAEALKRCGTDCAFTVNMPVITLVLPQEELADAVIAYTAENEPQGCVRAEETLLEILYEVIGQKGAGAVQSWEDLAGRRVAYVQSETYAGRQLSAVQGAEPLALNNELEVLSALAERRADVGIISYAQGKKRAALPAQLSTLGFCPPLQAHLYFSREHSRLAQQVSETLAQMKGDGSYAEIVNCETSGDKIPQLLFLSSEPQGSPAAEAQRRTISALAEKSRIYDAAFVCVPKQAQQIAATVGDHDALSQLHNYYAARTPTAIIADGEAATRFIAAHYRKMFMNVPLIITGALNANAQAAQQKLGNSAFVLGQEIAAAETAAKILELFPKTQSLLVLNGSGGRGEAWKNEIKRQLNRLSTNLNITFSDSIDEYALARYMRSLEGGAAVLVGNTEGLNLSAESFEECKAPVFSLLYDEYFKYELGGKYGGGEYYYAKAFTIIENLLAGSPFPVAASAVENPPASRWIFNYPNLRRHFWLPQTKRQLAGALMQNKPLSPVKTPAFMALVFALLALCALGFALLYLGTRVNTKTKRRLLAYKEHLLQEANGRIELMFNAARRLSAQAAGEGFFAGLSPVLESVAKSAGAERLSFWEVPPAAAGTIPQCTLLAKWEQKPQEGQATPVGYTAGIDAFFPDWAGAFKNAQAVLVSQSQCAGLIKYQMAAANIQSRILLPLNNGASLWGFACFDNPRGAEGSPAASAAPEAFDAFDTNALNALHLCALFISFRILEHNSEKYLKAARAAASSGTNAKSTFLANMSHEIRTPLNAILGMSDLALMDKSLAPHIRDYAQNINDSSRNLLGIINDILDFSKIETGKLELAPAPYEFASMIHDVVSMARIRADDTFLSLFIRIAPDIPRQLIGDELRVKQILINLLTNAIQYTKEGSITLTISGVTKGSDIELILEVQDTGIGIKDEDQAKIFAMFERLDTKRNRNIEGTGLGLIITKQLCELMDGSIDFSSEYGNGSTFTAQIRQKVKDSSPIIRAENIAKNSVLVYEPRRRNRRFLTIQLSDIGVRPEVCGTYGELGEALAKNKEYDYIIASSLNLSRIRAALRESGRSVPIAVMADSEYAFAHMGDVKLLQTPVYCITLAQFLSGAHGQGAVESAAAPQENVYAPAAKVLVVDDNVVNLKVAAGLLQTHGIAAQTSASAFDALELLKTEVFDIVFMDHLMPEMDGIEAAHEIRKMPNENAKCAIIALTANAIGGTREKFLEEGMNDFLSKPIEKDKLNAMLLRWLPEEKIAPAAPQDQSRAVPQNATVVIQGINTAAGVGYAGNSLETYLDILKTYAVDAANQLRQMRKALQDKDLHNFTVHVHALKSASRSVGAAYAGSLAETLEKAGAQGNEEFVAQNAETCFDTIEELIKNIREYFAGAGAGANASGKAESVGADEAGKSGKTETTDVGRTNEVTNVNGKAEGGGAAGAGKSAKIEGDSVSSIGTSENGNGAGTGTSESSKSEVARNSSTEQAPSEKPAGDGALFKSALLQIKAAAEDFSIAAVQDALQSLNAYAWQEPQQALLCVLAQACDVYDYAGILEKIEGFGE